MGDDTLPFAEQIRQNARVGDRNLVLEIGHYEMDLQAARIAFDTPLGHHPAQAEALPVFYLPRGDSGWIEKQGDILSERVQRECPCDTHARDDPENQRHPLAS